MNAQPLSASTALVVGGTSGVGFATARQLLEAGVPRIVVIGRNEERGQAARDALAAGRDAQVDFLSVDVTDVASATRGIADAHARLGQIDVLVNSTAGSFTPQLLHDTPVELLGEILAVQALAPLLITRLVLPIMREQGRGAIVNVASDAAKVPTPGEAAIGAAMAAIVMFSRTAALEAKRDGIRVNVLTPSLISGTPTTERVTADGFSAKLFASAARQAHLGVPDADDVAAMIVFLCGPQAH